MQTLQTYDLQKETTPKTAQITIISPQQTQITPNPPSKTDILWDIIKEREQLRTLREEIKNGLRRASKTLSLELYLTQQILLADKIALIGIKETNITLTQNNLIKPEININTDGLSREDKDAVINAGRILIKKSRSTEQSNSLH